MIIVRFLGLLCISFIVVIAVVASCSIYQYFSWFHKRRCKHCNHVMEYKGLKDDEDDSHFLFYCDKCGSLEQVPRSELYRCTYKHYGNE